MTDLITYTAADLPPVYPTDRAVCTADAPTRYDLAQTIAALRAENRALLEQLHGHEDRLARYRDIDEAADRDRHQPHAPQWAPEPEDQS
jgi:hypothetical protein